MLREYGADRRSRASSGHDPAGGGLPRVAGGYFETMGMRLVRGRGIDRADVDHHEPVAVIDQTLARTYFPNQDPVGQRVASNRPAARRAKCRCSRG